MTASHVLLLPGMMCDERLWSAQVEALDIPATVADTSRSDNFAAMANQVLALAPNEFAIAGLSMGGILAFEIWRQAPERVTHLALLDTNPHADDPNRQSMRLQQIEDALAGKLRTLVVESLKPLYLAAKHRDNEALLGTILDMALALGPKVFERQSLAVLHRQDSTPTLPTITCPTMIMCGREDTLCPVEYHQLMAQEIPDAKLTIIEDCGHLATLEQPAVVTNELRRLFAQ